MHQQHNTTDSELRLDVSAQHPCCVQLLCGRIARDTRDRNHIDHSRPVTAPDSSLLPKNRNVRVIATHDSERRPDSATWLARAVRAQQSALMCLTYIAPLLIDTIMWHLGRIPVLFRCQRWCGASQPLIRQTHDSHQSG